VTQLQPAIDESDLILDFQQSTLRMKVITSRSPVLYTVELDPESASQVLLGVSSCSYPESGSMATAIRMMRATSRLVAAPSSAQSDALMAVMDKIKTRDWDA